jgi:hypothetical protein
VGGILGQVALDTSVTLERCTFSGEIRVDGDRIGGMVGYVDHENACVTLSQCVNSGSITGGKYTGGLIGYASAKLLYVHNCANIGAVYANRCSGGLIGCVENCQDLIVADSAVMAKLDFSSIGEGGTEKNSVLIPAGAQVGGIIGRTYGVSGRISGISLAGSMKGAANIITALDKDGNSQNANYTASGAIIGFNSIYAGDEDVMSGAKVNSYLHTDSIVVTMEMTDMESYLGCTRDAPIDGSNSRFSHRKIIYDKEKFVASGLPLCGSRIDQNYRINDEKETAYLQLDNGYSYNTAVFYSKEGMNDKVNTAGKTINHSEWMVSFYTWYRVNGEMIVSNAYLRDVINSAFEGDTYRTLGYQTRPNSADPNMTDYRFVAVMDRIEKPLAGYHIEISYLNENGKRITSEKTVYCNTLYTALQGGEAGYTPDQYAGRYFLTVEVESLSPALQKELTVTIQPFSAEQNGESTLFYEYRAKTYVLS